LDSENLRESEVGKLVRGLAVIIAAALMILPAYINYELGPTKLGFEAVSSMSIVLMLFAIGIILFIVAVGPEKFKPKTLPQ
jgi:hypothetical protein